MFIAALFKVAKSRHLSVHQWINGQSVAYTDNGILFSCKKEKTMTYVKTWMDLEDIMLIETSQSQKAQILYGSTCMKYLE